MLSKVPAKRPTAGAILLPGSKLCCIFFCDKEHVRTAIGLTVNSGNPWYKFIQYSNIVYHFVFCTIMIHHVASYLHRVMFHNYEFLGAEGHCKASFRVSSRKLVPRYESRKVCFTFPSFSFYFQPLLQFCFRSCKGIIDLWQRSFLENTGDLRFFLPGQGTAGCDSGQRASRVRASKQRERDERDQVRCQTKSRSLRSRPILVNLESSAMLCWQCTFIASCSSVRPCKI